jgi:ectoine hydroxylase-related dioxygenase (phytanoyl-CoA dioxygenase family)
MRVPPGQLLDLTERYHRDGCVVVENVFPEADRLVLERELSAYVQNVAPLLPPGETYFEESDPNSVKALHNLNRHSEYFSNLHLHPALTEIVRAVLPEGELLPTGTSYFAKLARVGSVTPPHQDNVFQYYEPPLAVTVTISLSAATLENGVLICRSGSHACGVLPHRTSGVMGFSQVLENLPPIADYPEFPLLLKPGDISLHHVNTIHYSGANRSGQDRRQFAVGYRSSLAVREERRYEEYQRVLARLHDEHRKDT